MRSILKIYFDNQTFKGLKVLFEKNVVPKINYKKLDNK